MIQSVITVHFGCFTIQGILIVPKKVVGASAQGYGRTIRTRRLMRKRDRLRNFEEEEI